MSEDWGEDTLGAEAQTPEALNAQQFKPMAISQKKNESVPDEVTQQHVHNLTSTWDALTPEQQHAGKRFYPKAHRAATAIAQGIEPGIIPPGKAETHAMKRGVYRPPGTSKEDVDRAAGTIAALSPSSPSGMSWEKNPQAAYEVIHRVTPEQMEGVRQANVGINQAQIARGALKRAKSHHEDTTGPEATLSAATTRSKEISGQARAPFAGSPVKNAGTIAIEKGYDIAHGNVQPGDVLSNKTGAFHQTIADPVHSQGAVVDGRSHDIAHGARLLWDTERGLGAQGRYKHFEQVHQLAAAARGVSPSALQAGTWLGDRQDQMSGQSEGQRAIGQGARRTGGRPLGQSEATGNDTINWTPKPSVKKKGK